MTKFKVIALAIGGSNKKIHRHGDIVTERNFPAGNAEKLVASGHLEYEDPADAEAAKKVPAKAEVVSIGSNEEAILEEKRLSEEAAKKEKLKFDDISKEELQSYLIDNQIEFVPEAGKKTLYKLYKEN